MEDYEALQSEIAKLSEQSRKLSADDARKQAKDKVLESLTK
jgi:CHASE3 domain sensor protein